MDLNLLAIQILEDIDDLRLDINPDAVAYTLEDSQYVYSLLTNALFFTDDKKQLARYLNLEYIQVTQLTITRKE